MKEEVSNLRLNIDEVAQLSEAMVYPSFDGVSKELRLAKAWGGYLEGEFGGENPYKMNGKRHSIADIEPTNSVAEIATGKFVDKNLVEQIDYLREVIQALADIVNGLDMPNDSTRKANICRTQMWVHLVEAKILLGLELGKIRDAK